MKLKKIKTLLLTSVMTACMMATSMGGAYAATGTWKKNSTGWYYSYGKGSYAKSEWLTINNKKYYFNAKGYMVTDWQKISKKWYYFGTDGYMRTGWQQISGKYYYFGNNGVMRDNLQKISGKYYYFINGAMHTGWAQIGTDRYYFNAKGVRVTGQKTINKKVYMFNSNGVLLYEMVKVPSLVNKTQDQAITALKKLGLNYKIELKTVEMNSGIVLAQDLAAKSYVAPDSTVTLTVSLAPPIAVVKMIDLSSYQENQVALVLQDLGLKLGKVTYKHDKSHADGDVLAQSVAEGTKIYTGRAIDVTICNNTTKTVYRYKTVIDWEYTTTKTSHMPDTDWVKDKDSTTENGITTYYWKKPIWSDWSSWSTTAVKPSGTRQVETDQRYIY